MGKDIFVCSIFAVVRVCMDNCYEGKVYGVRGNICLLPVLLAEYYVHINGTLPIFF